MDIENREYVLKQALEKITTLIVTPKDESPEQVMKAAKKYIFMVHGIAHDALERIKI